MAMAGPHIKIIVSCLILSDLYFELSLSERLRLVKSLARQHAV